MECALPVIDTHIEICVLDVCDLELGGDVGSTVVRRAGTNLVRLTVIRLVVFRLAVAEHSDNAEERVRVTGVGISMSAQYRARIKEVIRSYVSRKIPSPSNWSVRRQCKHTTG